MGDETTITTDNGLIVVQVEARRVELHRSDDDDDHQQRVFATLSYDRDGRWSTRRDGIKARDLVDAVVLVDRSYGRYLRAREAAERIRQQEPEDGGERVDPQWQAVIDRFGPKPDATE